MITRIRPRAGARRAFTLVEVMIAMVAGLIVALAVIGLSREASNTFHEETRIAAAEMQLRTAIDRLRADVARASYMSTGNIFIDPNILTVPGTTTNVNQAVYSTAQAYKASTTNMSLYSLAGVRLYEGGSNDAVNMPLEAINYGAAPAGPDSIQLAGNMTSVEILTIGAAAGSGHAAVVNGGGCGTQRIYLDVQSTPALWRLVGMSPTGTLATYSSQLLNAFEPINPANNTANAGVGAAFIVRIEDNTSHKIQYAATCPAGAASWDAGTVQPYVDLDTKSHITLTGVNPSATINPVQIVSWKLMPSMINPLAPGTADATKYDLVRQYIDAYGATAGNPEVVAEYAVDLKFAFTYDTLSNITGNYNGLSSSTLVTNTFEHGSNSVTNATIAGDVSTSTSGVSVPSGPFPERIRAVRIRLVTRSALQDRTEPLAVSAVEPGAPADYLYRYCLASSAAACNPTATTPPTLVPLARTRTLISEVALPNQARFWFQ
jgi:prepilin-type N-terminal cleavage/methylation domain-containing protein